MKIGDTSFVEDAFRNVSEEISSEDRMHVEVRIGGRKIDATEHYFNVGLSAIRCIEASMFASGNRKPRSILDLPCGYGRVMRFLRAAFPQAEIAACDILRGGVDFCAKTFGAVPVYSNPDPERIELPGRYDLIWCGSLLTHLPKSKWAGFLKLFARVLEPEGILVFTTHGREALAWLKDGTFDYGLSEGQEGQILSDYEATGFGHVASRNEAGSRSPRKSYSLNFRLGNKNIVLKLVSYPDEEEGYGLTFSSPAWVCGKVAEIPNFRLISFNERAWAEHQDVVGCTLLTSS